MLLWTARAHWLARLAFAFLLLSLVLPAESSGKAALVPRERLPLRTEGRFIVDRLGERVKWACVNWYGPESISFAFGGLELRPIAEIVQRIRELGFNCVRVPYSLEAHVTNPVIDSNFTAANTQLEGKRFLDGFDAGIQALTDAGLMVIIDQHVSKAGYCCHWSQDEGFWYVPGYPEQVWIDSLVNMTRRYRANPFVVAFDLRNEVHDLHSNPQWGAGRMMTWGDGDPKSDWAAAATRAGNRVLEENKDVLIVVMALCFGMELRPMRSNPIKLLYPNRVVYQTHNYIEYQFWNLLPRDLGISFGSMRTFCFLFSLLFLGILCYLTLHWRRQGMPLPPKYSLTISCCIWLCIFSLLFALAAHAVYKAACTYCKWGAGVDFLPWVYVWLTVAALGALCAGLSWLQAGLPRPAALLALNVSREDDDSGDADEMMNLTDEDKFDVRAAQIQPWDRGSCARLQCCLVCVFLLGVCAAGLVFGSVVDTYSFNERWIDKQWGFALTEGETYTAPVWMGEFGYLNHGPFWLTFMRYLASRDVDFAYWAINGIKFSEGYNNANGVYTLLPGGPRWVVELFGILGPDWKTVKKAWMVRDLQALMDSPARWNPTDIGCVRDVLGHFCDVPFRGPEATNLPLP